MNSSETVKGKDAAPEGNPPPAKQTPERLPDDTRLWKEIKWGILCAFLVCVLAIILGALAAVLELGGPSSPHSMGAEFIVPAAIALVLCMPLTSVGVYYGGRRAGGRGTYGSTLGFSILACVILCALILLCVWSSLTHMGNDDGLIIHLILASPAVIIGGAIAGYERADERADERESKKAGSGREADAGMTEKK